MRVEDGFRHARDDKPMSNTRTFPLPEPFHSDERFSTRVVGNGSRRQIVFWNAPTQSFAYVKDAGSDSELRHACEGLLKQAGLSVR
jgi:hypothetical protein